jgi:hypothetical protein
MAAVKRRAGKRSSTAARTRRSRWSAEVLRTSNALDLEKGVFTQRSARAIAASLKRSARASRRRKAEPFRSAMSMLNFHINRGGRGLSAERRQTLERAKVELRRLFGREDELSPADGHRKSGWALHR